MEQLDRLHLGRAHVRRGEDAQRPAQRAVALDERAELVEAAELDEGAEQVDPVGALELAREVREDALAVGVGDEPGGEEGAAGGAAGVGASPATRARDPAQHEVPEGGLAVAERGSTLQRRQEAPRNGDLVERAALRADRDPRRVADERHELLVDLRVLGDLVRSRSRACPRAPRSAPRARR